MNFWQGKRVLVTGHTGFKGAWLTVWLTRAGAQVTGLSLPPETPSLFKQLRIGGDIQHHVADIRDAAATKAVVDACRPDVVFHLAAQSLVLRGYREPVETWQTNVMGTINVLEALRAAGRPAAVVIVTTDKVYENNEWDFGYREADPLGGYDPYSASKAATEIAVSCWRRSYLSGDGPIRIASARAGNVIGGGDWCENRIVPDMIRALSSGQPVRVRNPHAVRPWQHVLEPLCGYLTLGRRLWESGDPMYQDAFNFGPAADSEQTVGALVREGLRHWPGTIEDGSDPSMPHEAGRLALTIDRARARLGWVPRWDFYRTVAQTMTWYRAVSEGGPDVAQALTLQTIADYEGAMKGDLSS